MKSFAKRTLTCLNRRLLSNTRVREGFGSFHSRDIEDLVADDALNESPPSMRMLEETIDPLHSDIVQNLQFGKNARDHLFQLDPEWTFLNHGAFGAVLEPLMFASHFWRMECEKQPLKFFDRDLFSLVAYSLRNVASFLNCPATELYPLQNVTSGLNIVLQSLHLQPGDEVICFSLTYGSTKKMLKDKCERTGATLRIVELPLPITSAEAIVTSLENALCSKTKLVIIDQITSNTAMALPMLEMARAARAAGALVVVDAAHAMMSQPVSIYPTTRANSPLAPSTTHNTTTPIAHSLNTVNSLCIAEVADVWLTNGHKWLSAPKGCAFMWVHPALAGHFRPAIVSHGFQSYQGSATRNRSTSTNDTELYARDYSQLQWWHGQSSSGVVTHRDQVPGSKLLSALVWDGCRDYTSLLCVPIALALWQAIPATAAASTTSAAPLGASNTASSSTGMEACRTYIKQLLHGQVVPYLMEEWRLQEEDFAAPRHMRENVPMVLVSLSFSTQQG